MRIQLHTEVDLSDKRELGMMLAAFNAIASFQMHAAPGAPMQGPQGPGPMTAPAAAPAAPKPRKPRGGAAAAQPDGQEPELFPHAHPQQPGMPAYPVQGPVGTLGAPQAAPDVKGQLHAELRNFSTVCGPMALQGLLAYFGATRSSDLPMERADEIFQYIHAARAQMQQPQNAGA